MEKTTKNWGYAARPGMYGGVGEAMSGEENDAGYAVMFEMGSEVDNI